VDSPGNLPDIVDTVFMSLLFVCDKFAIEGIKQEDAASFTSSGEYGPGKGIHKWQKRPNLNIK
jgi:hypothetical protein